MAQIFEIPLTATPQRFKITLGGVDYWIMLTFKNAISYEVETIQGGGSSIVAAINLAKNSKNWTALVYFENTGWVRFDGTSNDASQVDSLLSGSSYCRMDAKAIKNYGGWVLDIGNASGMPMVSGIPLVTGIDLLGQYQYLGFNGRLHVQTTPDPDATPTFENLGAASKLYWVIG